MQAFERVNIYLDINSITINKIYVQYNKGHLLMIAKFEKNNKLF